MRGLKMQGVYRLSARSSDIQELKQALEQDAEAIDLLNPEIDINAICAMVKLFFRELPSPLFNLTPAQRSEYVSIAGDDERLARLCALIKIMPRENRRVLGYIVKHLSLVVKNQASNLMSSENISVIFSPAIFHPFRETSFLFQRSEQIEIIEMKRNDLVVTFNTDYSRYGAEY